MLEIKNSSGLVALVLVLIMTIVGAAAVSLAGRTVVETRIQEVNIDSSQARLAAEAGLEQALKVAPTGSLEGSIDANTSYSVTDQTTGTSNSIIGPVKSGEIWEINLVGAVGGSVNLYWESSPEGGAVRGVYVSVVNPTGITDYAIAPNGFGQGFDSGLISTNQSLSGKVFDNKVSVSYVAGTSSAMRVMVLGGDTILGFQAGGGGSLTAQIRQKTAVGVVTRGTESVKQGLGYYESVTDQVPSVFGYALYSGTTIVQ